VVKIWQRLAHESQSSLQLEEGFCIDFAGKLVNLLYVVAAERSPQAAGNNNL
jgi:hypothetical protein